MTTICRQVREDGNLWLPHDPKDAIARTFLMAVSRDWDCHTVFSGLLEGLLLGWSGYRAVARLV